MAYLIPNDVDGLIDGTLELLEANPDGAREALARLLHVFQDLVVERAGITGLVADRTHLQQARRALLRAGYFAPHEVGDDIAPRIIELTAHLRAQLDARLPEALAEALEHLRRQLQATMAELENASWDENQAMLVLALQGGRLGPDERYVGPFRHWRAMEAWARERHEPDWTRVRVAELTAPGAFDEVVPRCGHPRFVGLLRALSNLPLPACLECEREDRDAWITGVQERLHSALHAAAAGVWWSWDAPYAFGAPGSGAPGPWNEHTTIRILPGSEA